MKIKKLKNIIFSKYKILIISIVFLSLLIILIYHYNNIINIEDIII